MIVPIISNMVIAPILSKNCCLFKEYPASGDEISRWFSFLYKKIKRWQETYQKLWGAAEQRRKILDSIWAFKVSKNNEQRVQSKSELFTNSQIEIYRVLHPVLLLLIELLPPRQFQPTWKLHFPEGSKLYSS